MRDVCTDTSGLDVIMRNFLTGKTLLLLLFLATTVECWPWGSTPDCPPGPEPSCPLNPVDDAENYFEHPTDCHYYIHCDGSRRSICHRCSPTTYYSTTIKNCVWPMDAACTHNDTTRLESLQPPICVPGRCDLGEGKIRDYQDCSYFWECKGDEKIRKMCPPNQHFNARKMECQDMCLAGCEKPETISRCKPSCQIGKLRNIKCRSYEICEKGNWIEKQCPSNTTFHEHSNKCVAGCCGAECRECQHGEISDFTCSSYTICENNIWKKYNCSPEQKYDQYLKTCIAGSCCPDCGREICKTGKLQNFNCSTYTICENDEWKEYTCKSNQRFDQYRKTCVIGCCGINCEKPRCPKGEIGDFTCSTYKICENDDWKEYTCPSNQRFDQYRKTCVDGCCANGEIGTFTCSTYKMCENEHWKEYTCPSNQRFDQYRKTCVIGCCGINCEKPRCPKGEIGDFTCSTYKICENDDWKEYTCPSNQRFDQYRKTCVDGCCANGEIGTFTCSTYKMCENEHWKEYTCPSNQRFDQYRKTCVIGCCGINCEKPRCPKGEIGDFTCSTYKICENDDWKEYTCPSNQRFDQYRKTCVDGCCANGEIGTFTCSTYKMCENEHWKEYTCPSNQRFDQYRKTCVIGCCGINCEKPRCPKGEIGDFTCSTYKICENDDWKEYTCPSNQRFDQYRKTCVDGCCANGEIGTFTCSTYKMCENEHWKEYTCPSNQRFDQYRKTCVIGCCGINCEKPRCPKGEIGDFTCSTYKICENDDWKEYTCPSNQRFDQYRKTCVDGCCANGEIGTFTCSTYKMCENEHWKEYTCPSNQRFDQYRKTCVIGCCGINCEKPRCPKGEIGDFTCSTYKICENDDWKEYTCPSNQRFDQYRKTCVDGCCANGEIGTFTCSTYKMCENEQWKEYTCPSNQRFDQYRKTCVIGCCGINCEKPRCPKGEIGDFTCSTYKICENDDWKEYTCPSNQRFDQYRKTCVDGCCANGEIGTFTCSTYKMCENEHWKEYTCPSNQRFDQYRKTCVIGCCGINCEKPRCPKGEIGDFTCSTYKICENGDWKEYTCPSNQRFDQYRKTCVDGCCANGEIGTFTCSTYKMCENEHWKEYTCPSNQRFNQYRKTCVIGCCGINCEKPRCPKGEIGDFTCSTYKICENDDWKEYTCPSNQRFDQYRKTCVDGCCANGEIGTFTCSTYKMCENEHWKEYTCPSNQRFDQYRKTCVNGCCGINCEKPRCPKGEIGDFTCSTYKICENDDWKEYTCPSNQRFDQYRKTCVDGCCANGEIGDFTCSTYKICENGAWKKYACAFNQIFDKNRKTCMLGCCDNNCKIPVCRNGEIGTFTCSMYKKCENEQWKEYTCPSNQRFDQYRKTCVDGCCANGEIGTFTCSTYKICENEEFKEYTCPSNQRFDRYIKSCVDGCCGKDCDDGRCINGQIRDSGCSKYTICENGVWKEKICYPDQHYDKSLMKCVSGPCPCSPEGLTYEDPCSCEMYYKCTNGMKVLSMCQEGFHFNQTTHSCQTPCSNVCPKLFLRKPECCASTKGKPEPVCPTTKYRIYLPHPSDSKWFYHCENSVLYCNRCPPGYRWNIDTDTCDESCLCP